MHIDANGTRLWFDVDGPALVPDGNQMRGRPTVVLVHGGPGVYDHSYFKPDFARLAEHAQVVYLDLRGHGRSAWGDAAGWSFETCADDVRVFCDAAGIARPIVFGHSMGGPIVLLYGARHPGHAAGLIVQSGFAQWDPPRMVEGFRRVAGDEVAKIAGRSYAGEEVPDEQWARVLPPSGHISRTNSARLACPRISSSTRTGWNSSANSTSSISSAVSTRRRLSRSGRSTPSPLSLPPKRSPSSIPEIRGDPSAHKVAIVLCLCTSKSPARAAQTQAPRARHLATPSCAHYRTATEGRSRAEQSLSALAVYELCLSIDPGGRSSADLGVRYWLRA